MALAVGSTFSTPHHLQPCAESAAWAMPTTFARTGLFVPMESTLYVAAPAAASAPARVLVYHTR
jgi:hypothetical protein